MTQKDTEKFYLGKGYWLEYVRVNGYAWEPNQAGLKKLARMLDLTISHLKETINFYLES